MYTLAGLYLLTPVLSRWIRQASPREMLFYLALWGVTLCYPYLKLSLTVNDSETGVFYYFSGYVGYYVLGYWLRVHYHPSHRQWLLHLALCALAAIACPAIVIMSGVQYDFYSLFWYLSLPVAAMAFGLFSLLTRYRLTLPSWVSELSRLSFGVYLMHIFVMRDIVWQLPVVTATHGLTQIAFITIITLTICRPVVWLISKLPLSKYVIGV